MAAEAEDSLLNIQKIKNGGSRRGVLFLHFAFARFFVFFVFLLGNSQLYPTLFLKWSEIPENKFRYTRKPEIGHN